MLMEILQVILTMLKLISNPTAINPTKELLLKILDDDELKEKISIMLERKDVVYSLRPEDIKI